MQIFRADDDASGGGVSSVSAWSPVAIGLLLHELERFPGICILIANNVKGSTIHRLDPELTCRLKFLVEFKMPDAAVRTRMWRKMLPEKVGSSTVELNLVISVGILLLLSPWVMMPDGTYLESLRGSNCSSQDLNRQRRTYFLRGSSLLEVFH